MKIFIMRHGNSFVGSAKDEDRFLTECGINESRAIAVWFKKQYYCIDYVLISPYRRAIQTVSKINDILLLEHQVILTELKPNGNPSIVFQYLKKIYIDGIKSVLLVSHLPLICNLINIICPNEKKIYTFAPSSITYIKFYLFKDKNKILWSVNPANISKPI
ncbi:phosphohistidine phosphatase SixA [Pantoea sp. SoEX]|uniref:phosphohistidine phosphatase SixA n=1 Tax=Pantoea sp. SoEX TaxID=2576763 RepID=UPI00135C91C6|nr:phosphohistidine phosphatase SixA [Pantoea sp. SoEX]MXP50860.1 phosphohistidine phosphatase SixA [Pantoea sp. SoEX]